MIAVFVNVIAVIFGSVIGILFKKRLSEKYERTVFISAGIISLSIGINMVLATKHILLFALSLMLGGITGTFLCIEENIEKLGENIKKRFAPNDNSGNFALGFLTASMLFCTGSMAIVGSFQAGTEGVYNLIYTKSVMDGFIAIFLTGIYGIGVAFSALAILAYQGLLTLLSAWLEPYVSKTMLTEITGVGGAMIIMIGINMLKMAKIKTGDFLPALIFTVIFVLLIPYITFL